MIGGFKRKKISEESEGAYFSGGGDGDENIQAVLMGVDHVCTSLATPQVLWGKEGLLPQGEQPGESLSTSAPWFSPSVCVSLFLFKFSSFLPSFVFGCTGSSLVCSLSLVVESEGCSSLQCTGFSLQWLLWLRSPGSRHTSFSTWASAVHGSVKPGTTVGLQPSRLLPP